MIIPTYERRELVKRAVASVLGQTYRDFELIVVDDGSCDSTGEALAPLADRLRYRWQPNRGVAAARNAGIRLARGSILAFLDSDNRWLPEHLAVLTEVLARRPDARAASTCPRYMVAGREQPEDARLLHLEDGLFHYVARVGFVSCVGVRKDALLSVGGFDERMKAGEDSDLLVRLGALGPIATVRRRTIVRPGAADSLAERSRRSGDYLTASRLGAANWAAAVEALPESARATLIDEAKGTVHLASAMLALDRGDRSTLQAELDAACRLRPLSRDPEAVDNRVRQHLTRAHDPSERLRARATLSELWPDARADTAKFMRARAIASALRLRRPRVAAQLLRGWPRGGSRGFVRRVGPIAWAHARRALRHRHRGREAHGPDVPGITPGPVLHRAGRS